MGTHPIFESDFDCLTDMGVHVQNIRTGDGVNYPRDGDVVTVHYTGMLVDGKVFDSSRTRDEPFRFILGKQRAEDGGDIVIRGWNEGISQMSLGQRAKLTCEPDYAFKDHGYSGVIPPKATLVFDITLLGIEPGAQKLY